MARLFFILIALGVAGADLWGSLKAIGDKTQTKAEEARKNLMPTFWGDLYQKAEKNFEMYSDQVDASEVLKASMLKISSCSGEDHAMKVRDAHFDVNSLELHVKGYLSREVAGGKVFMNLNMGKSSKQMSRADILKRKIAWVASGKHFDEEPLCKHVARYEHSCPLKNGDHELRFGFNRLPHAISAGGYVMTVNAIDEVGAPVLCVTGSIEIPHGPHGELFRRLQSAGTSPSPPGPAVVSGASANMLGLGVLFLTVLLIAAW